MLVQWITCGMEVVLCRWLLRLHMRGSTSAGQQGSTVVGGEQWPWPVVAVTGETPGSYEVLQTSRLCTFLLFFFSFQGVYVSGDCTVDHI